MRAPALVLFAPLFSACHQVSVLPKETGSVDTSEGAFSVDPTEIAFPLIFVGQTASEAVTVTNEGTVDLALSATISSSTASAWSMAFDDTAPVPGASAVLPLPLVPSPWAGTTPCSR